MALGLGHFHVREVFVCDRYKLCLSSLKWSSTVRLKISVFSCLSSSNMHSFFLVPTIVGIAFGSPAPQGFDPNVLDAIPVTMTQGPPVGVGAAQDTGYVQVVAQQTAAAAASAVVTAVAKRAVDVAVRDITSTNIAPTTCTPVGWINTFSFTSVAGCPTSVEVGTYCGFINPDDPCAAQPNAYGPDTSPDTSDAFKANPVYHDLANNAKTPNGYDSSFSDYIGSMGGAGYIAYKTLESYDPALCSAYCDQTATCTGFNIFIERDPKWNPDKCSCSSPSIAQIKCSIWGQQVKKDSATNFGNNGNNGFEVVITASNGYNKKPATPPNPPSCSKPQSCGKKLHDHQPYCMGEKTFPGPYDPSLCSLYALKQNELNRNAGLISWILTWLGFSKGCVQIQASYLEKNGKGFGTNCRLFTKKFTPAQATLDIGVSTSNKWGCQKSYTWDLDINASFNWGSLFGVKKREE